MSACLSSTSDYAPNTNQLLTNYSFITRSLALSLALTESAGRAWRVKSCKWLDEATKTIGQFWKRKNARRNGNPEAVWIMEM